MDLEHPSVDKDTEAQEHAGLDVLCGTCKNLFCTDPSLKAEIRRLGLRSFIGHHTARDLRDSARRGCHLCNLIMWYLDHIQKSAKVEVYMERNPQLWVEFGETASARKPILTVAQFEEGRPASLCSLDLLKSEGNAEFGCRSCHFRSYER